MYVTPEERLLQKLENKETILGSHIFIGHPALTEAIAQTGYDVLWIDMEHTAIGHEALLNNLIAAKAGGTPSWVRIPWNDPVRAKPVLDMGVDGIMFPYVCTAEEAKLAADACSYPPEGIRGYGPLRALRYGAIKPIEYVKETYRKCRRIIQIEHIEAVKNLREIVAVEGIDVFIVGPNDLAASVGHIGDVQHPDMFPIYEELCRIMRESGKPFGLSTGYDPAFFNWWKERGATIFFCGFDSGFVQSGAASMLTALEDNVKNAK